MTGWRLTALEAHALEQATGRTVHDLVDEMRAGRPSVLGAAGWFWLARARGGDVDADGGLTGLLDGMHHDELMVAGVDAWGRFVAGQPAYDDQEEEVADDGS